MKRIQFTDAIRGIRKRFVSFLSIVLIVLIGAGAFYLTSFMAQGVRKTGNEYFNDSEYMDLQMISSLGASEQQIARIARIDGVECAEGVVSLNGRIAGGVNTVDVTIMTLTEKINIPEFTKGRAPTNERECAIASDLAKMYGFQVNDTVRIYAVFNDSPVFKNEEVKITGIYNHPNYVRNNSSVYTVLVDPSAIDEEVTNGLYTRVIIRQKGNDSNTFFQEYFDKQKDLKQQLTELSPELERSSVDYVKNIGLTKIEEKQQEVDEQIAEAQKQIDEAREKVEKELAAARAKINESQSKLDAGYNELVSAEAIVDEQESKLKQAAAQYNSIKKKVEESGIDPVAVNNRLKQVLAILKDLEQLMSEEIYQEVFPEEKADALIEKLQKYVETLSDVLEEGVIERIGEIDEELKEITEDYIKERIAEAEELIDYLIKNRVEGVVDGTNEVYRKLFEKVDSANKYLISMLQKAISAINQYLGAEGELESGKQKIADARYQISVGWLEYEDGKRQLENGRKQYNQKKEEAYSQLQEAQNELDAKKAEAYEQLDDARKQLDDLSCRWLVTDRRAETGYNDLYSNSNAIQTAGKIFGILFAVVGGLVCFSTLVIIIEEERKLVGTSKAFGFHNNEILGKYLMFGVLSTLSGCLLAIALGIFGAKLMQNVIYKTGMFNIGVGDVAVDWKKIIYVTLAAVILSTLVTVAACIGLLRSPASVLMKGQVDQKPKKNKASTNPKGSLYSRLIIRNMINDKARVIVSIVIVAGSVLVIGIGFCMRDSFKKMLEYQAARVDQYSFRLDLGNSVTQEDKVKIEEVLSKHNAKYVQAAFKGTLYLHNDNLEGVNILVCDEGIIDFINIADPKTKQKITLPSEGALVQLRMVENDSLSIGDSYTIYDDSLNERTVSYAATYNNYIGRQLIMSKQAYEKAFGKKAKDNCYYVDLDDSDLEAVKKEISDISHDVSFYMADSMYTKFRSVLSLYGIIVVMMLGFAVIMSFMILTNLANIFITRKKKELIVMRINGYSIAKTKQYLARETIITTLTGLVLGVVLGAILSSRIIMAMEQPDTQFARDFNLKAWILAVVIESLFSFIVYAISFRKIDHLNFREIA
ncbi:MAG: FtsX-like permease family protein [Erysipelotrichaceae bacterium]|nr:FtsX-like permease family protein [Erysipelotrichaceae bacterium]